MAENKNEEKKVIRIWDFISFSDDWKETDTSLVDDLSSAWFRRREKLQGKSKEYEDFMGQLKREHAIETGIVERLYDLSRGVTETFIKQGFVQSYLSHGDTNIAEEKLMGYLNSQLDAVNFVFDVVKSNRELTTGFIKELHALVTSNQDHAEGRDQFGNKTKIALIKGKYKEQENNPVLHDGTIVFYCPPEHVASEMDNLVKIYGELCVEKVHPLIISAWFHYVFTTIHPFQDGNGRVARLLSSLILIQQGLFPLTVLREESKAKYIDALAAADGGIVQPLVSYFAEVQRRNIEKALNLREVDASSLEEVAKAFSRKVGENEKREFLTMELKNSRDLIAREFLTAIDEFENRLGIAFPSSVNTRTFFTEFSDQESFDLPIGIIFEMISNHSQEFGYHFNRVLPIAEVSLIMELDYRETTFAVGFPLFHYGYENNILAVFGSVIKWNDLQELSERKFLQNIALKPFIISLEKALTDTKKKSIREYVLSVLTIALAEITNQL
jgi:fido (protein-threonine AMPylation protein)